MSEENIKLTVSPSPHKRSVDTTRSIMLDVIIALMPALIMSVVLFDSVRRRYGGERPLMCFV